MRCRWQRPEACAGKARGAAHLIELAFRIGITARGRAEHNKRELGRERRRYPVLIDNILDRDNPTLFGQALPGLRKEGDAALSIEVMEETRQHDEIEIAAPVHIERRTR